MPSKNGQLQASLDPKSATLSMTISQAFGFEKSVGDIVPAGMQCSPACPSEATSSPAPAPAPRENRRTFQASGGAASPTPPSFEATLFSVTNKKMYFFLPENFGFPL